MTREMDLPALDGANPLAFLAALGTLATLSDASSSSTVQLGWRTLRGAWRPVLHVDDDDRSRVLATLQAQLRSSHAVQPFSLGKNLNVSPEVLRRFALDAVAVCRRDDRRWVDFVTAFGSDVVSTGGVVQDTAFRTMSGAGHQHFLQFMRQLTEDTEEAHLADALFEQWRYADAGPSLRWDPADNRRYALRWNEPSGDPIRTVRGANRLAIEGLRFFPTAPVGRRLETTGFHGSGRRDTFWTWPIWSLPAGPDVVRSIVSLDLLQAARPDRNVLCRMGIVEVYRSQRLTIGKYRNFSPARSA